MEKFKTQLLREQFEAIEQHLNALGDLKEIAEFVSAYSGDNIDETGDNARTDLLSFNINLQKAPVRAADRRSLSGRRHVGRSRQAEKASKPRTLLFQTALAGPLVAQSGRMSPDRNPYLFKVLKFKVDHELSWCKGRLALLGTQTENNNIMLKITADCSASDNSASENNLIVMVLHGPNGQLKEFSISRQNPIVVEEIETTLSDILEWSVEVYGP